MPSEFKKTNCPKKQNPPLINQGWEKIAMKKKNITKLN